MKPQSTTCFMEIVLVFFLSTVRFMFCIFTVFVKKYFIHDGSYLILSLFLIKTTEEPTNELAS